MRAFVLAGGGSLGAVQAGMLQTLLAAGIVPDLVVGTSVGALNGALLAGAPTLAGARDLSELWRGLRRRDVFPVKPLWGAWAALGSRPSLVPASGLAALVDRNLRFDDLEDAPVPLAVVTTDLQSGAEVVLDTGPARAALLASSAIPGVLPSVTIAGRVLVDGAVSDNTPIGEAVRRGASEVWVLPSGFPCALKRPPESMLPVVLQALTLLIGQRLLRDLQVEHGVPVHFVPPLCPVQVPPHDFTQGGQLIDRAAAATAQWLAQGLPTGAERLLRPHHHPLPG